MTVVVNNASGTFLQALKAMAKLDGASVSVDDYVRNMRKGRQFDIR